MPALVPRWGIHTDIGKARELNEDFALVRAFPVRGSSGEQVVVAVIADGMGGHAAGDVASLMAVDTVMDTMSERLAAGPSPDETSLRRDVAFAIRAANRRIYERSGQNPSLRGMGTTLTVLALRHSKAVVGHVGDTRAYLVGGKEAEQLTEDHSLPHARNQLLRAVGTDPEVEVDVVSRDLLRGQTIVMATDGAYASLASEDLAHAVQANAKPREVCEDLVRRARTRDGSDNLTMICLQFGPPAAPAPVNGVRASRSLPWLRPSLPQRPGAANRAARGALLLVLVLLLAGIVWAVVPELVSRPTGGGGGGPIGPSAPGLEIYRNMPLATAMQTLNKGGRAFITTPKAARTRHYESWEQPLVTQATWRGAIVVLRVQVRVKVPEVEGLPAAAARERLRACGLNAQGGEDGTVIEQRPRAGEMAPADSPVALTVRPPAPAPTSVSPPSPPSGHHRPPREQPAGGSPPSRGTEPPPPPQIGGS